MGRAPRAESEPFFPAAARPGQQQLIASCASFFIKAVPGALCWQPFPCGFCVVFAFWITLCDCFGIALALLQLLGLVLLLLHPFLLLISFLVLVLFGPALAFDFVFVFVPGFGSAFDFGFGFAFAATGPESEPKQ
jgi:hypothetical protein